MKIIRFAILIAAVALSGAGIWSCKQDSAQSRSEATTEPQKQPSPHAMPAAGNGMMQHLRAGCPMVVQESDVVVSDTEGGVALTFTTGEGDVSDLRTRVQRMAQMYEMHRGHGALMWHHMGGDGMGHGGPGPGMGPMGEHSPMPAANATVTEIDKGARLELEPTDPSQLEALREHIRWHGQRMHAGECWMLPGQPTGPSQGGQGG